MKTGKYYLNSWYLITYCVYWWCNI